MGRYLLRFSIEGLSWLGGHGSQALVGLVLIGMVLPWIGALLKPLMTGAVFVLLSIAFLRVDAEGFRACLRRPGLVAAATVWSSLALPLLFGGIGLASGVHRQSPDLFLALLFQGVASPMMASPSLAALMGLDATLVLTALIAGTAILPLTAPMIVLVFAGAGLPLTPGQMAVRLILILAGAALAGAGARRWFGPAVLERQRDRINGINILVLFVFVAGLMEGTGARFWAAPAQAAVLTALAFAVFFAMFFLTTLLFLPAGRERALALGFMASQRNLGLMLAAVGGALPELTLTYFALSQFPIYLSPQMLQPLARRVLGRSLQAGGGKSAYKIRER